MLSNVIAYGGVYDAFGINVDCPIIAPGGYRALRHAESDIVFGRGTYC